MTDFVQKRIENRALEVRVAKSKHEAAITTERRAADALSDANKAIEAAEMEARHKIEQLVIQQRHAEFARTQSMEAIERAGHALWIAEERYRQATDLLVEPNF